MMRKLIAAALLLGSTATPALAQETYRASGTEPFWSLTIDARTMTFEAPGQRAVVAPTPRVIHGFAGEIWQGKRISVNTNHVRCNNGMNDRNYADTVTVTVDGRTYRGCGGDYTVATPTRTSLLEGEWRIEAIDGRPVSPQTSPTITFRGERMSGNASCNQFSGSFRFARGRLDAGPVATTRRMCGLRVQNVQESNVLQVLGQRVTVSSTRAGKLVLTGRPGQSLTLAPIRRR
ncbi:MAG: META domain-containing protein [Sphingomonadales bacterium]|nr:MAG: META domain-containing protein [Sphingomonadales bacterium]